MHRFFRLASSMCVLALAAPLARAQIFTLTREQKVEFTAQNPFDRFPDGRPKIPGRLLDRAKEMSAEEAWAVFNRVPEGRGYHNQYEDGFQVLHPGKRMAGRAFTVQFMPARPDIASVLDVRIKPKGYDHLYNQVAIDMLQPGDVLVVDLFGKKDGGTIVGDNLFYYIMKTAKGAGLVVDGSIRDLDGISEMEMPAYFRFAHPSAIANGMLTGINIPVRVGNVTVMPGDLALGDPEGVYFIPPHLVQPALDNADEIHVHDEWTRKKFDEGKYKSSDIYGSPKDPALQKEYQDYLKRRLEEIRKGRQ